MRLRFIPLVNSPKCALPDELKEVISRSSNARAIGMVLNSLLHLSRRFGLSGLGAMEAGAQ